MNDFKKNLANLILTGAAFALVAFVVSLALPKYYLVTGKVVIVPSGTSATAGQNLYLEAANTAEIVNSPSFRANILGDDAANFAGAKRVDASSIVAASYLVKNEDVQKSEDILVTFPEKIATYARDLYSGQPFKYIMVSDPEVSASYVKPDLIKNSSLGFAVGALLYFLYWIFSSRIPALGEGATAPKKESSVVSPAIPVFPEEAEKEEMPLPEPLPEPQPEPEEKTEPMAAEMPESAPGAVPENLPVAAEATPPPVSENASENHEPTDDEVKDRLNRLMRGEL